MILFTSGRVLALRHPGPLEGTRVLVEAGATCEVSDRLCQGVGRLTREVSLRLCG